MTRDHYAKGVELIDRAAKMLTVSASYIRDNYPDAIIHYDEADCDGYCVADDCESAAEAIAALPAVVPVVKPLGWDRYGNAQGFGCRYMVYELGSGWNAVLYPSDAAYYQIATGVSEAEAIGKCDADNTARILAALDLTSAPVQPDPAAIREALEACRIIDEAVREGHESVSELVLHLLSAADPALAALALIHKEPTDD